MITRIVVIVAMAAALAAGPTVTRAQNAPEIRISDVQLFYRLYDAAGG